MKAILMGAAALSLLAAPAFAQTAQTVAVNGNVDKQCGLGNQSGGGTGGYTASVDLGEITDANGFLDTNASVNIGFGNVWCNAPAALSLSATSLVAASTATDTSSFVDDLDMIVDGNTGLGGSVFVYFGGATEARTGSPAQFSIPQEFETGTGRFQSARVRLALPTGTAGNDRPIAGAWTGSVTLTVSPS